MCWVTHRPVIDLQIYSILTLMRMEVVREKSEWHENGDKVMKKNQVEGRANEVKGKGKEVVGQVSGDENAERKSEEQKGDGKAGAVLGDINRDSVKSDKSNRKEQK